MLLLFSSMAVVTAEEVEIKQLVPMFLSGTLFIGDSPAKPGTVVSADLVGFDAGTAIAESFGVYGNESQPMMVQAGPDESLKGKMVTFWVNGVQAEETIPYNPGENLHLDIHISSAAENKLTVIPQGGDVFIGEEGLDVPLSRVATPSPGLSNSEVYLTEQWIIVLTKKFFYRPGTVHEHAADGGSGLGKIQPSFIVKDPSVVSVSGTRVKIGI